MDRERYSDVQERSEVPWRTTITRDSRDVVETVEAEETSSIRSPSCDDSWSVADSPKKKAREFSDHEVEKRRTIAELSGDLKDSPHHRTTWLSLPTCI